MARQLRRTPHQMLLGAVLRRLREASSVTREEVMDALGWSATKMSRIEAGKVGIRSADIDILLGIYGAYDAGQHAALLNLAEQSQDRGWYAAYNDVFNGPYPGLEDAAIGISAWEPRVVPGLLQTPRYIRSLVAVAPGGSGEQPASTERRVQARLTRQAILTRPNPPTIHFVIGESALRWEVGGPHALREQLLALRDVAVSAVHVTVQVVPFRAGATLGLDGPFVIFTFEGELEIAYSEGPVGGSYLDKTSQLADTRLRWQHMLRAACSPEESAEMIAQLAGAIRD